ncbi:PBS lyase [Pseudomonas sp. TWP3-2]|uniref:PBS lyase n=1 Tax=Pseudomonas sp. TWP3-2 TaxID=2804574 RepID=UPI003CE9A633
MSSTWEWLDRLKNKHTSECKWEERRRAEALELLANAKGSGSWIELSTHDNGFVREVAVRELCNDASPETLVALIVRLNDWVPQIRELARAGLNRYLTPLHASALLFALVPLIALAARQRADHGPTLHAARAVLQLPETRAQVHADFLTRQGKAARYLFALLLENDPDPQGLLRDALAHRELIVRLDAVAACQQLPAQQASPLLVEALARQGAKVRVCVLRALLPLFEEPRPLLRKALLDASPAIRSLARWSAPRHDLDTLEVLDERLAHDHPTGKREWLGILGLAGEIDACLDQRWLTAALRSSFPTVRQATAHLLGEAHLPELLGALDDPCDKVFATAIVRLDKQSWSAVNALVGEKLDRDWHELSPRRRQQILHLRPGWQQVAYLLQRLEKEPVVEDFWLRHLNAWCDGRYAVQDSFTPKTEREAVVTKLRDLAAVGLICKVSVTRFTR